MPSLLAQDWVSRNDVETFPWLKDEQHVGIYLHWYCAFLACMKIHPAFLTLGMVL